jgi:S-adenosylmethionine/arginine decarboxylase-like enzyme
LHTWPEAGYIACDVLTCGKMRPEATVADLKRAFKARQAKVKIIPRGF